jgi:MFS family permease
MIAFVSWFFVQFLLKETPPVAAAKSGDMKLTPTVYAISLASFVHTLFINAYSTNIGIYILQNITENTTVTGVVTALNAVFALMVGATFAKISGALKKYTVSFAVLAAAVGYGVILLVPGMAGVYVTSALCGVSLSCFMAGCSLLISVSVAPEAVAKASGIFSVIGSIGGLIAPIVMGNAATAICGGNTPIHQFLIAFVGMLILGIIMLVSAVRQK